MKSLGKVGYFHRYELFVSKNNLFVIRGPRNNKFRLLGLKRFKALLLYHFIEDFEIEVLKMCNKHILEQELNKLINEDI